MIKNRIHLLQQQQHKNMNMIKWFACYNFLWLWLWWWLWCRRRRFGIVHLLFWWQIGRLHTESVGYVTEESRPQYARLGLVLAQTWDAHVQILCVLVSNFLLLLLLPLTPRWWRHYLYCSVRNIKLLFYYAQQIQSHTQSAVHINKPPTRNNAPKWNEITEMYKLGLLCAGTGRSGGGFDRATSSSSKTICNSIPFESWFELLDA